MAAEVDDVDMADKENSTKKQWSPTPDGVGKGVIGYVYIQKNDLGMEVQAQGLWVPMQKGTSERVMYHHRTRSHLWTL